jgi:hypothetical protein
MMRINQEEILMKFLRNKKTYVESQDAAIVLCEDGELELLLPDIERNDVAPKNVILAITLFNRLNDEAFLEELLDEAEAMIKGGT